MMQKMGKCRLRNIMIAFVIAMAMLVVPAAATVVQAETPADTTGVSASELNLTEDFFRIVTMVGDTSLQAERYNSTGTVSNSSVWGTYANITASDNGAWKVTALGNDIYCFTNTSGSQPLRASSETAVGYANGSLNTENTAQQWKFVEDTTTENLYDGKLVNVSTGTALAYAGGASGDPLQLLPVADAPTWFLRDVSFGEDSGFTVIKPYMAGGSDPGDPVDPPEPVVIPEIAVDPTTGALSDNEYDGPRVTKIRVLNEGAFLEVYWDRYVDEVEAVNVSNFVLKNGERTISLSRARSNNTNTLYFDKDNKAVAATDADSMSRLYPELHMSSIGYSGTIDPSLGLTLEIKGDNIKDNDGKSARSALYTGVPKTNYYTQFLTSQTGIVMKADDTVDPETLVKAAAQVDVELGKAGTNIAETLVKYKASLAIYSPHENVYLIPEHRGGFSYTMYDVEGYGGNVYNNCVSSIAERNILRIRDNTEDPDLNTAYRNENILLHEFGHCVKSVGIEKQTDSTLYDEYMEVYQNAKDGGLWPNTYAISNNDEFFATMCAIWFNNMAEKPTWDDGVRCPINTREELKNYDPMTYAYFEKILPSDLEMPAPWDEPAPDEYHDEYIDPNAGNDKMQATEDALDTDIFRLVIGSGDKHIERYAPNASNRQENLCLWWCYGNDLNTADTGSWGYKVTKVADGVYGFAAVDGRSKIQAIGDTEVTSASGALDPADKTQLWAFVENATTANLYDGYLINVANGQALTHDTPTSDGSILRLTAPDAGRTWMLRDCTQTTASQKAYIKPATQETVTASIEELNKVYVAVDPDTGAVDRATEGPKITKIRVLNEGDYLEIYWDRYMDEEEAVNINNFVLKNGDEVITLRAKGARSTNTIFFDKKNKQIAATDANSMARLDENLHMSSIGLGRGQAAKLATIAPEGLTLEVKGENIKDEEGNAAENITYTGVPRTNFYTQFLMSDTGILMKADDTVAPETLVKAANQVDAELGKAGTGIAERMAEFGCSLAIYSPHENVYLIPEHRSGYSYDMYDVEGYGGSTYNKGVSSIAERNITRTRDNTEDPDLNTAYRNENILLHEFGHCVKSVGIDTLTDKTLSNEYKAVYKNAKEGGLWPNTYAMGNSDEFFATMCAIWFNNMAEKPTWDDGVRCPINTREEMKKYDPVTYAYFEKILPSDIVLMSPWDEPAPDEYHDEYVDPTLAAAFVQKIADKVDALPATDALTMDDAEAVEAIRASYDLLNEGQKALFDEEALTKLEAAEETIEVLKVLAENGDALNAVKEQIAALPEIADDTELTEEQIAAINAAKAAYDALPEEAKALIDAETTAKLTAAVEKAAEQTAGETPGETAGGETPGTTPGGTTPGTTPGTAPAPAVTETELAKLEAQIFALKNKKELPTAEYGKLKVKQKTVKKSSIKISWSKIKGASGYVVYGNTKGAGKPFEKLATVTKNSYTQKKLKKGTYYKYLVVAFQNVGTDQKVLSASKTVTIATSGGKAANPGKVKAKKKSLTVKVKKKVKISASAAKPKKGKVKKYRKLSFESADKTIATVTSKGVVKGVKKGKVKIYVYAQNGLSATVTVKVKK